MKKLFFAVAMLAVSFSASAQLTFGVKAGANLSTVSDYSGSTTVDLGTILKSETKSSMKFGFNVGAFAEYRVNDMFGVQVEALYSLQGVNTKNTTSSALAGASSETTANLTSSYINVPVLAKVHFGKIAAYVGPQFGFVAGMNTKYTTGDADSKKTSEDKVDSQYYNAIDCSLALGASYMVTSNIGVDARYNLGLTNTFKEQKDKSGNVDSAAYGKNGSIQVGVFYAF